MTDEEIKQAISNAVGDAFAGIQAQIEKLNKPPEEKPKEVEEPELEPLQTRISNAIKSYAEDKREYMAGRNLEYKPNNTLKGEGKDV